VERPALLKGKDDPAEVPRTKGCHDLRSTGRLSPIQKSLRHDQRPRSG
jgi:hypothetical protein